MFTRLFGGEAGAAERSAQRARAANLVAPSTDQPSFADAIPNQVTVAFHAHDSAEGTIGDFLTAATRGLVASGQRELVLTLRLGNREPPIPKMQEIVRFCTTVHAWAEAGKIVDEGGFTQFGERGLFGEAHCGLLYAEARAHSGVQLPERALAAIFVQAPEIRAAVEYGTYRVLTRIGAQLRIFPCPSWGALDRPSAITPRESETLLAKVRRMRTPTAHFLVTKQCLRLSIPRQEKHLASRVGALPADVAFALLTRPAPNANAILTWRPGQRETIGISPDGSDGSRMSGSFVLFIPSAEGDQARPIEDGYSVRLSPNSWASFVAAVAERRPLSLEMDGRPHFELEWR